MATTLTSLSQVYGPTAGGTALTLTGTWNAAHSFTATVGGAACTSIVVVSATSITCTTGSALDLGPQDFVLTDITDSSSSTLTKGFCYLEAGQMCLAQLRLYAQQRADQVNSQFLTTSEWNTNINQSSFELHDLLVTAYGNDYEGATPLLITTDGSTFLFPLPNGVNYSKAVPFYKLLGLDLQLGNTQDSFVTLKPFKFSDRNRYAVPNFQSFYGLTNLRYRIYNNQLWLTPIPAAGQTLQMWYVPRMTEMVNDTDLAPDGISGWLEYVITDAAIKAMQKEESDVTVLAAQKMALIQRINDSAANRDAGMPSSVGDTQQLYDNDPFSGIGGNGFNGGY